MNKEDLKQISDLLDEKLEQKLEPIKRDIGGLKQTQEKIIIKLLDHDEEFRRIRGEIAEHNREVLDIIEPVMADLQIKRDEQVAHSGSHQRIDDELAGHDSRISVLEKVVV